MIFSFHYFFHFLICSFYFMLFIFSLLFFSFFSVYYSSSLKLVFIYFIWHCVFIPSKDQFIRWALEVILFLSELDQASHQLSSILS